MRISLYSKSEGRSIIPKRTAVRVSTERNSALTSLAQAFPSAFSVKDGRLVYEKVLTEQNGKAILPFVESVELEIPDGILFGVGLGLIGLFLVVFLAGRKL
jgi:hypothetical protein